MITQRFWMPTTVPIARLDKILACAQLMNTVVKNAIEQEATQSLRKELRTMDQELYREVQAKHHLENELRDSQIKTLQMQFNTHFLFNLMNTICSLATIEKAQRTQEFACLMGDILRSSLKNGSNGTVDKEVGQIEQYIKMHTVRYRNRFAYSIDISPEIREYTAFWGACAIRGKQHYTRLRPAALPSKDMFSAIHVRVS